MRLDSVAVPLLPAMPMMVVVPLPPPATDASPVVVLSFSRSSSSFLPPEGEESSRQGSAPIGRQAATGRSPLAGQGGGAKFYPLANLSPQLPRFLSPADITREFSPTIARNSSHLKPPLRVADFPRFWDVSMLRFLT
ncbi:hypothetical protein KM043_004645 [Ampulex compressa]|nr:hypothetical protein KM043_004645 [Ampulex compressa]